MQPCSPSRLVDTDKEQRKAALKLANTCVEKYLVEQCSQTLLPDQMQWITAGWKGKPQGTE